MDSAFERSMADVQALLRRQAGIDPESLGAGAIAHAVQRRLVDHAQLFAVVEFDDLLDELLVPETWFFRDVAPYRFLKEYADHWRRNPSGRVFRAASVACSTGEEAYSIAMILNDCGLGNGRSEVLGVDLCRQALRIADRAMYGPRSLREPDPSLRALFGRYVEPADDGWQVQPALRRQVQFRRDNLASREFLLGEPTFSIIFCRNVLIYFHPEARRVALANLARLLQPGGVVICGHSEGQTLAQAGFVHSSSDYPCAFGRAEEEPRPMVSVVEQPVEAATGAVERIGAPFGGSSLPPAARPSGGPQPSATTPPAPDGVGSAAPQHQALPEAGLLPLLRTAAEAADTGRLAEAEAFCRQALAVEPSNAEGHYLLGVIRQAQGMDDEARHYLDRALYLHPNHYEALIHRMLLAQRRGDHAAAENYRRRARRIAGGKE